MLAAAAVSQMPLLLGLGIGVLLAALGAYAGLKLRDRAREDARTIAAEARADAEARANEIVVAAQEKVLALEEDASRREQDLDARELTVESRARQVDADLAAADRQRRELERRQTVVTRNEERTREALAGALSQQAEARRTLERVARLTAEEARAELVASIEEDARKQSARIARRIEDEARERAEKNALQLLVQATQRLHLKDAAETTVTFIELPSDEMKGRIIGREGRNIRALEFATGIDIIIDETPRAILVASFDPARREIARVAIGRLVEDGRIHPARIEEVVEKVRSEFEELVSQEGARAAFDLGAAELHPRLARLVGRMKYRFHHGHLLLEHAQETARIAAYMAAEVGAREEVVRRAGLLHEIGRVEEAVAGHPLLASAEIAAKFGEAEEVVHAIRSLHPDHEAKSAEALLLRAANRISENRPGARKDNLHVFVERLRRLETLAAGFPGVTQAFAVKAGKEIRVLVDAKALSDGDAYALSRQVAKAIERDLEFPGQVKVSVVRETRAVQYAV